MIFLGDLSVPDKEHLSLLLNDLDLSKIIKNETVILNLEGVLLPEIPSDCFWKVYNCKEVLELRKHCKKLIVSLANNHLYDFPEGIQPMTKMLEDNDIDYFGLYENNQIKPYEFSVERIQYAVFGHCWNIYTKSNPNKKTSDRVVDCTYQELYNTIKEYINKNPETRVICFPHWNFDLEEYPFPAHKKFSRDLIDAGAEIVVGNHAHCMQEAELYKGKVIAYGLGNLYMPSGVFFNGKLCFPEISNKMCAIKIKETNGAHTVYDFFTDIDGRAIVLKGKRTLHEDSRSIQQYIEFFKINRKKKTLVPIFRDYKDSIENRLKTEFLLYRINSIRLLKKLLNKGL